MASSTSFIGGSPDPLEMKDGGVPEEEQDMIVVSTVPVSLDRLYPSRLTPNMAEPSASPKPKKTPGSKATKASSAKPSTPTGRGRGRPPKTTVEVGEMTPTRKSTRKFTPTAKVLAMSNGNPSGVASGSKKLLQLGTKTVGSSKDGPRKLASKRLPSPSPGQLPSPTHSHSHSDSNSNSESPFEDDMETSNLNQSDHISRSRFLAKERTLKLKEARNFVFKGDAWEARTLRGGKVVGEEGKGSVRGQKRGRHEEEGEKEEEEDLEARRLKKGKGKALDQEREMNEDGKDYDNNEKESMNDLEGEEDWLMHIPQELHVTLKNPYEQSLSNESNLGSITNDPKLEPIKRVDFPPPNAKKKLSMVLNILCSRAGIDLDPTPFDDEPIWKDLDNDISIEDGNIGASGENSAIVAVPENGEKVKSKIKTNEALSGLVSLLLGTVKRGEGNSCLVLGAKGSGKNRTVNRAISLVSSSSTKECKPMVVRLDGLAQVNDMLAIREMGRQINEEEGRMVDEEGEEEEEGEENFAPTTLPAHLLALLTQPSQRSIVILLNNFDMFTQHARQALLYCLLDVVQSIRTGPVESTGRGVAVIGITSRIDTQLLLEKRVKSRFSQRVYKVVSPSVGADLTRINALLRKALIPWSGNKADEAEEEALWVDKWQNWVESILSNSDVQQMMQRTCDLSSDVRLLYRPFVEPIYSYIHDTPLASLQPAHIHASFLTQLQTPSWTLSKNALSKLSGLSSPALVVLIIAKHFAYAGKEEFNFAMVEFEYVRFAKTGLSGSGRIKWSSDTLLSGFDQLLRTSLLIPATRYKPNPNPYMKRFLLVRCTLSRNDVVGYFKGEGGKVVGTELGNWGRMAGGHA